MDVSRSSRCTWNCIFTHAEAHDGVARARNKNLSGLVSETYSTSTFRLNSWLSCSYYRPTFTFPPVPPSILLTIRKKVPNMGSWCSQCFTAQKRNEMVKKWGGSQARFGRRLVGDCWVTPRRLWVGSSVFIQSRSVEIRSWYCCLL
jgi:hypothetical protein